MGNVVLVGRRGMDGERGRECFRRCLTSLDYKRRENLGEAGEGKKRTERGKENWRIGKILVGEYQVHSPDPVN